MRRVILAAIGCLVLTAWCGTARGQTPQNRPAPPPPQPWQNPPPPPSPEELRTPPPAAVATGSGLVTLRLRAGQGEPPDGNDMVAAHFTGWTANGAEIQSTRATGPAPFDLENVFPGWREGLQLMTVGEQRRLWIPAALGTQKGTPQDTVFDIEVVSILRIPNLPEAHRRPPEGSTRTLSGAFTKLLEPGTGKVHPGPQENALVAYVGWQPDGKVFDTTLRRGRSVLFPLERVMPAFAECVQQMTIGEKRLCWIPGAVAGGQWPGSPKGDLIFEIVLEGIYPAGVVQQGPPPSPGG